MTDDSSVCNIDPDASWCSCNPPCNSICAVEDCLEPATQLVPAEIVFGSKDGKVNFDLEGVVVESGWDTWVCDVHGV